MKNNKNKITLSLLESIITAQIAKIRRLKPLKDNSMFSITQDYISGAMEAADLGFRYLKSYVDNKKLYKIIEQRDKTYLKYRGFEVEIQTDDYGMIDFVEFMGATWCSNSYLDITDMMDHHINNWLLDCSDEEFKHYCDQIGS